MKNCSNSNCLQSNPQPFENFRKQTGRKFNLSSNCKKCITFIIKKYKIANKEKISLQEKNRYNKNKDKILKKSAIVYSENPIKFNKRGQQYYLQNKEQVNKRNRNNYNNNPKAIMQQQAEYRRKNKQKINERNRKRRKNDLIFRIKSNLRTRLRDLIRGKIKAGSAVDDLGCEVAFLDIYFKEIWDKNGWNWDNYGKEWEIDHKIPLSYFDLTKRHHCLQAFHYTNLRPMSLHQNRSEGNRRYELKNLIKKEH